jgi:hypothetical protein
MKRVVLGLAALCALAGCKKEAPQPPPGAAAIVAQVTQAEPEAAGATEEAEPLEKTANEILDETPLLPVTGAQVTAYLDYRHKVVQRAGGLAGTVRVKDAAGEQGGQVQVAASVRTAQATRAWAKQMGVAEEAARKEAGLSRDEVLAVGRVVGEVLSARQIWRMSGGDEALQRAREELPSLDPEQRAQAQARLLRLETDFAVMREARSARGRYGDAAVDAVLQNEEALWRIQRQTAQLTSGIY